MLLEPGPGGWEQPEAACLLPDVGSWWAQPGILGDRAKPLSPEHEVIDDGLTISFEIALEHKPDSPGCSVLMFEPSGTSSTGDRHEGELPDYVDATTGHQFA